eukprot:CAMPEP_0203670882 /NCGR_PEP_ID=MMETSP0090-20130426/6846_1 /ASSEMBLY_ACC=CAM_ASM_001088 /TAXON_ID=426623 /ORGANISM="Chaetoceros affinis, Strain CCMP159" /LENGTH=368 /DNA_ID=CAMNT_0050535855 /DNA_START=58 /DNA_END=1160 /DNA_ORIENTATION=+
MSNDISWRECNIHSKNADDSGDMNLKESSADGSKSKNNGDEIEQQQRHSKEECEQGDNESENADEDDFEFYHLLFPPTQEKTYETFEYDLSSLSSLSPSTSLPVLAALDNKIELRGYSEINNSTGLSMWLGAEVLSNFLLDCRNAQMIRGKKVLELGSGLGLCGIICHYLGADRVLLTDGDSDVLSNLRYNVRENVHTSFCDESILTEPNDQAHKTERVGKMDDVMVAYCNDDGKDEQEYMTYPTVSCPQHIWGKAIDQFKQSHGMSDVILAADCLYITQSLEPFWQSIDQLLVRSDSNGGTARDDDESNTDCQTGDGILIYIMKSSSAAPLDMVLEMATKYGFTWTTPTASSSPHGKMSENIFIFRR